MPFPGHCLLAKLKSMCKWSYLNISNISLILLIFLLSCRDYFSGDLYDNEQKLTDKVVIVTGANTGIGKEVVRDLAKREAKVIMACRDMEKCESVLILLLVYYYLIIIKYQINYSFFLFLDTSEYSNGKQKQICLL